MSINLLPWRETLQKKHKKRLYIESAICFVSVIFGVVTAHVKNDHILSGYKKEISLLRFNIDSISRDYEAALNQKKQQAEEIKKENFLKNKIEINKTMFKVLDEIIAQMPDSIYLIEIVTKIDKLHLIGKSPSHADLAKFLEYVKLNINKQPILTQTSQVEDRNDEIDFNVEYEI